MKNMDKIQTEYFFTKEEYKKRVELLKKNMLKKGIDLFITCSPGNICYLNGYISMNVLDIMFLVVPLNSEPEFYLWQFEKGRANSTVLGMDVFCWDTGVDPVKFLCDKLISKGYKKTNTYVDTGSNYTSYDVIQKILDNINCKQIANLVEDQRLVKSKNEIWI